MLSSAAIRRFITYSFLSFLLVCQAAAVTVSAARPTDTLTPTARAEQRTRAAYATLPLSFVPNEGQLDARVRYAAQTGGSGFYFTPREAVFAFPSKSGRLVLRLGFVGANPAPAVASRAAKSGTVNYLIGNDPARWQTNLPTYGEIVYHDLWPGIDLVFRGESGQLKYEFLLEPGADPDDLRLAYDGARRLSVDTDGNLIIDTVLGNLTDARPITYQNIDGKRVVVPSHFELDRRATTAYGFAIGAYDDTRPLVVDPGLVYSTFLGGADDDSGYGIAVDSAGQAYVTGGTNSTAFAFPEMNFPRTAGAYDTTHNGSQEVFVTKFNSSGSGLIYSTYFGGSNAEPGSSSSIAIDASGYAYITGTTRSPDFPVKNAFQWMLAGASDAFVTKLERDGSAFVYSTFLGGEAGDGPDVGNAIAVDSAGHAYVTGFTTSQFFPTQFPGQAMNAGLADAYVTELNSSGGLLYSTYLGGSSFDVGEGIAIDRYGKAYVTGYTFSPDFPRKGVGQPDSIDQDAFVSTLKFNSGTELVYSRYLGGSLPDRGLSIAVDWSGNAYVTGDTFSPDFPTAGAFQTEHGGLGGTDAFVTKLNSAGSAVLYSSFLGGDGEDSGHDIAVDSAGQAYVTGITSSSTTTFPTTPGAFQREYRDLGPFSHDAFVTMVKSTGQLLYSTYLGGSMDDLGHGIAVDRAHKVYVTGSTISGLPAALVAFPTTQGAYDTIFNGTGPFAIGDAFVTKLAVPVGEVCHRAHGDGHAVDGSGRKETHHFHKKSSTYDPDDYEPDNVRSDDDRGSHFQSTAFTSTTYAITDVSQAITIVGTGLHNGLPVAFTMAAINYGDVAPGVFNLTLSDGYTFIGRVIDGFIDIE